MKEKRKLNKTLFVVLGIVFTIAILSAAAKMICTPANNVSIGWVEHKQADLWEADYSCFTGAQTSNLQGANTKLDIDVETDEGSLEILLKDTEDNVLFSKITTETTSFSVDVPERVIVSVSGKEHDGGFSVSY